MITYQLQNSVGTGFFESIVYENYSFQPHLHRHYEMVLLIEGSMTLYIDGSACPLRPGDAAVILPDQIHSYETQSCSRSWISVFSADLIHDPDALFAGHLLSDSRFHPDNSVSGYAFPFLLSASSDQPGVRARLHALCAASLQENRLLPRSDREASSPAQRLLEYSSLHFREDITLRSAAAVLGYDPGYLSRCFRRLTRTNFRQFLNACRVAHACQLISSGTRSMTEAALESGFQSVRTFNRAFREQTGRAPGSWLAR